MPSIMYNEKFKQINLYKDAYLGDANMETYPLGKLLCDFLNLDLKEYDKKRAQKLHEIVTWETRISKKLVYTANSTLSDSESRREWYINFLNQNLTRIEHPYAQNLVLNKNDDFAHTVRRSDLVGIQQKYRMFVDFCLNPECDESVSTLKPQQRFLIMLSMHDYKESLPKIPITSTFFPEVSENEKNHYFNFYDQYSDQTNLDYVNVLERIKENKYKHNFGYYGDLYKYISVPVPAETVEFVKNMQTKLYEACSVENIDACLFLEFSKLIFNDMIVKNCAYCGKYFILKGNYKTDFCDDIPKGKKLPCKMLGSNQRLTEKILNDPIYGAYRKTYKRYYAWIRYGKISPKDFNIWAHEAKENYKLAITGEMDENEFFEYLKIPPRLMFEE
ncbi:MAG: hypothetical protein IJC83_02750 [Oscillospiraceae bacterium]|nr:hypothetical protein [Oscillospiraceae bacterium]